MFHSFESFINNPEALDVLIDLKLHGIVNHIGVSVYTNKQLEYLINEEAITVVQLPFNLLDNISIRGDLIKQLKVKGKIIHTRSAFLQGLFFKNLDDQNKIVQKLYPQIKILKQITIQTNCLMEELALAYCIQQDNIDNVIIGVDSINHLEANLKAANFCIEEETMKTLDAINVNDINLLNPSLWQSKQF
jgi:aryl-alcohol dehydrogenase-like predicted oxidoreductase